MALEVETGTGSASAESLCSVAQADAHHAARGGTAWAALATEAKEQALRRATDYMQQVYRTRWAGLRISATQALDWPRVDVPRRDVGDFYPSNAVPAEVVRACAELAAKSAAGTVLLAYQGRDVLEQTVGPITTRYAQGSTAAVRFSAIDAMLGPLFSAASSAASMRLVRG